MMRLRGLLSCTLYSELSGMCRGFTSQDECNLDFVLVARLLVRSALVLVFLFLRVSHPPV